MFFKGVITVAWIVLVVISAVVLLSYDLDSKVSEIDFPKASKIAEEFITKSYIFI